MPQVKIGSRRYELSEVVSSDRLDALFSDVWTGSRVWNASIFLSKQLTRLKEEKKFLPIENGQNGRVIELGSGCGLVGLVARDLGAVEVVVTDQAEIVELLNTNILQNAVNDCGSIRACEFTWGSSINHELRPSNKPFDYVLVSDCINPIYGVDSWRNLARSIYDLGDSHTICYLSYEERGDNAALYDFHQFSQGFLSHELVLKDGNVHLYCITQK